MNRTLQSVTRGLATAAVVASVGLAGASTAQAREAACNDNFVGGTNNSGASLQAASGSAYRKGPGAGYCNMGNREGLAYIWCTKRSADGNPWYLARDNSSGVLGWIWAGNVISTSGTIRNC